MHSVLVLASKGSGIFVIKAAHILLNEVYVHENRFALSARWSIPN